MYELEKVGSNSYYIQSPAKIGVYVRDNNEVFLIDSGNDKDAGRRIKKIIESNGWDLKGILVTHSNADHIGGCNYLQKQTGCKVFSEKMERAITENPFIEPSFLYGGYPFKELRNKFLVAQPSECIGFDDEDFPKEVEIIEIPGHFFDMVAYKIPDGTVFLADCMFSKEILDKYKIPFVYDVEKYIETLEMVKNIEGKIFIPSHALPQEDVRELADYNIQNVNKTSTLLKEICKEKVSFDNLLKEVFDRYELKMDFNQYVLVGSTVRSFLSWLKDKGELEAIIEENMILWKTVDNNEFN